MTGLSAAESIIYLGILIPISYMDYKYRTITNKLLISLLIVRIIFIAISFSLSAGNGVGNLLSSVIVSGISLMVVFLFYPYLKENTAAGDQKLLIVCGFCFDLELYLLSLLLTMLILVIWYVFQLIGNKKRSVPFAPYFCSGVLIATILSYSIGMP